MDNSKLPLTEEQIRALRDKVYDQQTTDKNWECCKEYWSREDEVRWLQEHAA
jgi:hypothetical protein